MSTRQRALIVDDEPDIRELLEITLGRMKLDTRSARNVKEAREWLAREPFDLCLTDMRLPDGTGLELVQHIQQRHAEVPVAMITASGMLAAMLSPVGSEPVAFATVLGFHPVYLATAIGSGTLVGSWMNDSGFWIFAKMGGLTELETLRSWTPLLAVLGVTGLVVTIICLFLLPLA